MTPLNHNGYTPVSDLLDVRLRKSVQATCKHPNERANGGKSGWPSDTYTTEYFCPDCLRYRYEEMTMAEMDHERRDK